MASHSDVALLITGSEIMDGRVHDTNALFASRRLAEYGIKMVYVLSCDDEESSISRALSFLLTQARFVIISGGLGPTTDDRTREAVAAHAGCDLMLDEQLLDALKLKYQKRGRKFESNNTKQATRPRGSLMIPNEGGTAAGFILELTAQAQGGAAPYVYSLPGVPWEFTEMFNATVLPHILRSLDSPPAFPKSVSRFFGLPEAHVGSVVEGLGLDPRIDISYRAHFPEIQLMLKGRGVDSDEIERATAQVRAAIGEEYLFSTVIEGSFEGALHELLIAQRLTVAVAESCTGGLISSLLTATPGASAYLKAGVVSYSNQSKYDLLGVKPETVAAYGVVSHEVAREMVAGVRSRFDADLSLSITGLSGPGGGSETTPVGTFFIGFAARDQLRSFKFFYPAPRERARRWESWTALDLLRRHIKGLPFKGTPAE